MEEERKKGKKENFTELQKPNVEAEVYNNKKSVSEYTHTHIYTHTHKKNQNSPIKIKYRRLTR